MFRSRNLLADFAPRDGDEVEVLAQVGLYEPRGDYQLTVESVQRSGLGQLYERFMRLRSRLQAEGLFDPKRPLPAFPRAVGVVTSLQAAALRDVLATLARRSPQAAVVVYPVPVQGAGAGERIASMLETVSRRGEVDVVLLVRGGGSIEDLWAFNEEVVARAVYESGLPLISAVGHEVDFTISDFVADLRAPTPSAAAEMVSGAREDLRMSVNSLTGRLSQAVRRGMERRRLHLERLVHNKAFAVTPNKIRDFQQRFDEATSRMSQAMRRYTSDIRQRERVLAARLNALDLRRIIKHKKEILVRMDQGLASAVRVRLHHERARLELAVGKVDALSPLAILKRGFALCRDSKGAIVKRAADVTLGDNVRVTLAAGELDCRIESKITNDELRSTN
jgi:exodeoxyribonuclease VII large subunit